MILLDHNFNYVDLEIIGVGTGGGGRPDHGPPTFPSGPPTFQLRYNRIGYSARLAPPPLLKTFLHLCWKCPQPHWTRRSPAVSRNIHITYIVAENVRGILHYRILILIATNWRSAAEWPCLPSKNWIQLEIAFNCQTDCPIGWPIGHRIRYLIGYPIGYPSGSN